MDTATLQNIAQYLGNGWVSIALTVLAVGILVWWFLYGHQVRVDAATQQTEDDRQGTEQGEAQKTATQDQVDQSGRTATDTFLDPPPPNPK